MALSVASSRLGGQLQLASRSQREAGRPALLRCAWPWGTTVSLAGSHWSVPDPNLFLPCFPISHLAAFLNDLIGKLFSKAIVNYSISSILQPLKEAVQSISRGSCSLCSQSPRPPHTTSLWVTNAGRLEVCAASPKHQRDAHFCSAGHVCCVCLGWLAHTSCVTLPNYLTILCLSFLICNIMITAPTSGMLRALNE